MAKIHFRVLGCRLNQAEAEQMAQGFKMAGHHVVDQADQADVLVVNSCSVTQPAGAKSRRAAQPARPGQKVIVTGCHSQVSPGDFKNVDLLVPNEKKHELVTLTLERFGMDGLALGMDYQANGRASVYPLALGHTRAFVKIQDGCNLRCTFCMTTLARGASHSRPADDVVDEVAGLAARGCREVVLTGVHAGSYHDDRQVDLGALLERILEETPIGRIRLSSLEPWNFKPHWTALWTAHAPRLCRHLHMSLQSGSDTVLRRMERVYDRRTYAGKVEQLRQAIPNLGLTTDLIVGFPGETEEEHRESMAFVEEMCFSGAHVFTFSPRPGTVAAALPNPVERATAQRRFHEMRALTDRSAQAFRSELVGSSCRVLWEEAGPGGASGLTDHFVRVSGDPDRTPNTFTEARLEADQEGRLKATPL